MASPDENVSSGELRGLSATRREEKERDAEVRRQGTAGGGAHQTAPRRVESGAPLFSLRGLHSNFYVPAQSAETRQEPPLLGPAFVPVSHTGASVDPHVFVCHHPGASFSSLGFF